MTASLPRKYRPTGFTGPRGIVGQPHVCRSFRNAAARRSPAQAYLLTGPRGTGKTTAARLLAAALAAPSPDGEPDLRAETVRRIIAGNDTADVVEIDAATNRGAEDARSLRQRAMYAPSTPGGFKVYIVDEAHMLTREAWNALLKILEEPPPRVVFIFCTTDPQKIEQAAAAILSRCQRLDMRRLSPADLGHQLRFVAREEGVQVPDEAIALIARHADGGMRDALSVLDQMVRFQGDEAITAEAIRSVLGVQSERLLLRALEIMVAGERADAFRMVEFLDRDGADMVRLLADLQDALCDLALVREGGTADGWSRAAHERLESIAVPASTAVLVGMAGVFQQASLLARQIPGGRGIASTAIQQAITVRERTAT